MITNNKNGDISEDQLVYTMNKMLKGNHDESSRFVYLLTKGSRNFIIPEDFVPLIQDIVDTHPGLGFLKEATEFHSRYVHTVIILSYFVYAGSLSLMWGLFVQVIARIYFSVNRSWTGRITVKEIRKSALLKVIRFLEEEEDINRITEFFSYEHFYVIYCKFWELDKDHDLFIDQEDLSRHNDHGEPDASFKPEYESRSLPVRCVLISSQPSAAE